MSTWTSIKLHHESQHTKNYQVSIFDKTISTVVTTDGQDVIAWIDEVKSLYSDDGLIVGLNVEWRSFCADRRNPAGILQLCVGTSCLIYQIHRRSNPVPPYLQLFLSDPKNTCVGVRIRWNLTKLAADYDRLGENARYVELAVVAANRYKRPDLNYTWPRGLASTVLGKDVEKPLLASMNLQWDNLELTMEQVQYATIDPFLCVEIARFMNITPEFSADRLLV